MSHSKVEIIINRAFLRDLVALLERLGVEGYTVIDIGQGKGPKHGTQITEGLLPVTHNVLLFAITSDDKAARVAEGARSFLDERDGILVSYSLHHVVGLDRKK